MLRALAFAFAFALVIVMPAATALQVDPPASPVGCLWDRDTLEMEQGQFPEVHEIIAGNFLRHSEALYRWRIEESLAKLEADPGDLRALDDLGVAYEKTGQLEKALEVGRRAEKLDPDRYETIANLGTFLVHAGRLEEGLVYIRKAIQINPDAHFGREIIQQYLVEYVILRKGESGVELQLPMRRKGDGPRTFRGFLAARMNPDAERPTLSEEQQAAAVKGLTGMVHFGNDRSPVLMEALGDVLVSDMPGRGGARRLGARAYLRASIEVQDEDARKAFRGHAQAALSMQTVHPRTTDVLTLDAVEKSLRMEMAAALEERARVQEQQRKQIERGESPTSHSGSSTTPGRAITIAGCLLAIALLVVTRRFC